MTSRPRPISRPKRASFSSGPCPKPPGWEPGWLVDALVGRSHRSAEGLARIAHVIRETARLLKVPADYRVALLPGSDTGAFEAAMWSLLGARGIDVLAFDVFGQAWVRDILEELRPPDVRTFTAEFGHLPDLSTIDESRDLVFTLNGTTSGVCLPDLEWIRPDRQGLTLVDATSAVFAMPIDWSKVDALTFSWQKCLGGEAGHGMIVLSPRAHQRLKTDQPAWPRPKLLRLADRGQIDEALFVGQTINTPSMLCVEDYAQALAWADRCGGLAGLIARCRRNADLVYAWAERSTWIAPLAIVPATRSVTSVCLRVTAPQFTMLDATAQRRAIADLASLLAEEGVAFDIAGHRGAPPGLRLWTGPTVEADDIAAVLPWFDWAFCRINASFPAP